MGKLQIANEGIPITDNVTVDHSIFDYDSIVKHRLFVLDHVKRTKDPESLPDLEKGKAPVDLPFVILAPTEKPGRPSPKLFDCPYCNKKNKFWDGRILLCEDGRYRLIGHQCAGTHVGHQVYARATADYDDRLRRIRFERIRERLFPAVALLVKQLSISRQQHHHALAETGILGDRLRAALPELHNAIGIAETEGGALKIGKRVEGKSKRDLIVVHRIRGIAAITSPKKIVAYYSSARDLIEDAHRVGSRTAWPKLSGREFSETIRRYTASCRRAIEAVSDAEKLIQAHARFFSRPNIEGICGWANHADCNISRIAVCSLAPRGLRIETHSGDVVDISVPVGLSIPSIPAAKELARVLDDEGERIHDEVY